MYLDVPLAVDLPRSLLPPCLNLTVNRCFPYSSKNRLGIILGNYFYFPYLLKSGSFSTYTSSVCLTDLTGSSSALASNLHPTQSSLQQSQGRIELMSTPEVATERYQQRERYLPSLQFRQSICPS